MTPKTEHRLMTTLNIITIIFLLASLYLNIDTYHTLTGKWLPW